MISKLFENSRLSKSEKKKFIPFVNERNFMGALLPISEKIDEERVNELMNTKNLALIENLRKSTKQYFFDKKYEKMVKKQRHVEESLHKSEPNYDEEVNRCFETLNFSKTFYPSHKENQNYYVDLKESLNHKISCIKRNIISKIQSQRQSKINKRFKSNNLETQFEQNELRATRNISVTKQLPNQTLDKSISRQIFKDVGKNSQFMTDFSNQGLKYRHLVQSKKINPWKKWYIKENIEIFPGETISLKKLQKTIY